MGVATVGCGPQKKYCPDASDGICPEPTVDSGSNPPPDAGDDRGSIYIEAGR
jgi:hypothetical protein